MHGNLAYRDIFIKAPRWEIRCAIVTLSVHYILNCHDLKTMMKASQISPWAWNIKSNFEMVNDNQILSGLLSSDLDDRIKSHDANRR